jgi:hypothetical protein
MADRNRITTLARKGFELGLREVGQSPEMRAARKLAGGMPEATLGGPRVLFLTPRDWASHVQWEALMAQALRLRGADVRFVTCGGGLELCDRANTYEAPPPPCHTCAGYTKRAIDAHGLPRRLLSDDWGDVEPWPELDELSCEELAEVVDEGVPLGALTYIPLRWFLCTSDIARDPLAPLVLRRLLRSARTIARSMTRSLTEIDPEVVVMLNGLFLFESIAAHLAATFGIRVVSYERGFVHGTLFFAHGPCASRYEVGEHWPAAHQRALEPFEEERLDRYLEDRRHGRSALYSYWPNPVFDAVHADRVETRRVAVFTNLTWDSAVLGIDSIFPSMQAWLIAIVEQLGGRKGVTVTIRVHPAEVLVSGWETREPVADFLAERFGDLPPNVQLIAADDPMSSYPLMAEADLGLVYSSTTGLELALAGTPVIAGARPHYTGKGFTLDAADSVAFARLIDQVLADPSGFAPSLELARRYANLLFFEAGLAQPPATEPVRGLIRLDTTDPDDLRPGRGAALDVICRGILRATPFYLGRPSAS